MPVRNEYDVVIVGAGPAGTVAGRFAAAKGVSVLILEKDRDVGYPVRCGEAISGYGLEEYLEPDPKWIASKITNFMMIAPDGAEVLLPFDQYGYILERRIFDYELGKRASEEGAEILTRAYVNGLIIEGGTVRGVKFEHRGTQKEVKAKVVIGADGVESRVGRWAGIKTYVDFRDMECCVQITASGIPVDTDTCYFYFGSEYAPGGYFWVFPKGKNIANIGLGIGGMTGKTRSAQNYLDHFMKKNYPNVSVLTSIAGGVPCVPTLERISVPGLMLAGDAGRMVNPLSGGGISSGMRGGEIAGTLAAEAVLENNPEKILGYDKLWHNRLGKKHETYDRIKSGIYNFSDEKFNNIAHSFAKVPLEKRTLASLFRTALINNPSLLVDVAKVFIG